MAPPRTPTEPPVPTTRQITGRAAEAQALAFLREQGMILVTQNFLCKTGEIDLIMRHGATLVFVEVRARADRVHGGAAASVTHAKQRRLIRTAQFYLQRLRRLPPCRFDVIAIDGGILEWLQNAIQA
jgi:putative endonuclease